MKEFIADFHIHSLYSRATSKSSNLENFAIYGKEKGLNLVSTGDFTHPKWIEELKDKLVMDNPGIYKFKEIPKNTELSKASDVRFILTTEISSIYKKNDKVRKIHSIVFAPDIETVEKINAKLDAIGNIKSDGRPILGLDVRNLLEIVLECSEDAFLVPAHIWTPWFSILGDKSGFDSVDEAFEDLAHHVFALETGLSSDPAMNWRLSQLDKYTLISNSDAHSPSKLAREANIFQTELDYYSIMNAMKTRNGFKGTLEFFPEEGKYHFNGHRNCGIRVNPEEATKLGNKCPVCGKELTMGTMHRVEELADRPSGEKPDSALPFESIIPLNEVLSELIGTGPNTKSVAKSYNKIIEDYGSELSFLRKVPIRDIETSYGELLAESVKRMRNGDVRLEPGYDGEYGKILLFDEGEIDKYSEQNLLFERKIKKRKKHVNKTYNVEKRLRDTSEILKSNVYTDEQKNIINEKGSIRVVSGPGTGKTHTLIGRVKRLLKEGVNPKDILILTFTQKAASEIKHRIENVLSDKNNELFISTFHSFGYNVLKKVGLVDRILDEQESIEILKDITSSNKKLSMELFKAVSFYRQTGKLHPEVEIINLEDVLHEYLDRKCELNAYDIDDLIITPKAFLEKKMPEFVFKYIFIDEFQDINQAQFEMCKPLFKYADEVFLIGDPDQAIYTFRGADISFFINISNDITELNSMTLSKSFRCPAEILRPAVNLIRHNQNRIDYNLVSGIGEKGNIYNFKAANAYEEAEFVSLKIKELIGAYGLAGEENSGESSYGFSDFAILSRTRILFPIIENALSEMGIPYTINESKTFENNFLVDFITSLKKIIKEEVYEENQMLFGIEDILTKLNENPLVTINDLLTSDNFTDLLNWEKDLLIETASKSENATDFVYNLAIAQKTYGSHPAAEKVSLLTLHSAKGLEFKNVFIVGCDDGIIPFDSAQNYNVDIEEERRLFYVGLTRAEENIYLTSSSTRIIYGDKKSFSPSRFLNQLNIKLKSSKKNKKKNNSNKKTSQMELF